VQQRALKPVNFLSQTPASGSRFHCEKSVEKISTGFDVGTENSVSVKSSDEASVNRKNASAYATKHGLVKVFEEASVDCKINVSQGTDIVTCGPVKMFDNQTCTDHRSLSLKQTTGMPASCAVQQSTESSEADQTVTADSRLVQNTEVQNAIIQLASELTSEELHNVYSRVFYRW